MIWYIEVMLIRFVTAFQTFQCLTMYAAIHWPRNRCCTQWCYCVKAFTKLGYQTTRNSHTHNFTSTVVDVTIVHKQLLTRRLHVILLALILNDEVHMDIVAGALRSALRIDWTSIDGLCNRKCLVQVTSYCSVTIIIHCADRLHFTGYVMCDVLCHIKQAFMT